MHRARLLSYFIEYTIGQLSIFSEMLDLLK